MIRRFSRPAVSLFSALMLAACSGGGAPTEEAHSESGQSKADAEPAKGPNGGKLFTGGDFTLELAIFKDGVPPQYRAWATKGGEPAAPDGGPSGDRRYRRLARFAATG